MSKEKAFMSILNASTLIQLYIAEILEEKADESQKSSNWICNHFTESSIEHDGNRLKQIYEIDEQVLKVIDGITKMETALGHNMKILLGQDDSNYGTGGAEGLNDLIGFGGGGTGNV